MEKQLEKYLPVMNMLEASLPEIFDWYLYKKAGKRLVLQTHSRFAGKYELRVRRQLEELMKTRLTGETMTVVNFPLPSDGTHLLKISAAVLRDDEGETAGVLCMLTRCDTVLQCTVLLSGFLNMEDAETTDNEKTKPLTLAGESPADRLQQIIREFGVEPGRYTTDELMEIILDIYDEGLFEEKGAVKTIAAALQISEQSVYRYVQKIKRYRD